MRTPTQSLCAEIRARVERHANAAHTESRTDLAKLLEIVGLYQAALERITSEQHEVKDHLAWEGRKTLPTSGAYYAREALLAADKVASRE